MTEPDSYTAQQAADPRTPAQELADIAALRPDLRPAVASNPSAYPALLEWLGGLGEPAVDAALRARSAAPPTSPPTAGHPATQPHGGPPHGGPPHQPGAPTPFGAPSGAPVPFGAPPYGAPPQGAVNPYASGPTQPYAGTPVQPYGGTPGQPYGGTPGQPYGGAPGQPYGGTPPRSGSKKVLWIVLGVLGGLLVLGIVAAILVGRFIAENADEIIDTVSLTALHEACAVEDWQACDDLYRQAPPGSDEETFGDTCGDRVEAGSGVTCVDRFGTGTGTGSDLDGGSGGDAGLVDTRNDYGDDPELDALWDACAAGDGVACDDLYAEAPFGSAYEEFGSTCGGTTDGSSFCDAASGIQEGNTYGDNPMLDSLWDACAAGDDQACDDLFDTSPLGSEYEDFGNTCGGRGDGSSYCVEP